jgi:hypothetical protein
MLGINQRNSPNDTEGQLMLCQNFGIEYFYPNLLKVYSYTVRASRMIELFILNHFQASVLPLSDEVALFDLFLSFYT